MSHTESHAPIQPSIQDLLSLRFIGTDFRLPDPIHQPENLTPVTLLYTDQLQSLGFTFSHELIIAQCIGKRSNNLSSMLVYLNAGQQAYAVVTDLYHEKNWVYFTHYFTRDRRIITTCQPGALQLDTLHALPESEGSYLDNAGSSSLASQWKKHMHTIASRMPMEKPLLMEPHQHLDAERQAYRKYTESMLTSRILRQSDTQSLGFTHTGARSYLAAITSKSAKRPNPKIHGLIGKHRNSANDLSADNPATIHNVTTADSEIHLRKRNHYRNAALAASAAVFALILFNLPGHDRNTQPDTAHSNAVSPVENSPTITRQTANQQSTIANATNPTTSRSNASFTIKTDKKSEHFIVASEEDEMWRIAVENAELYLMSNDGDPAPWIRTARKMAVGFESNDPRLARTHFLAALLESDGRVAEQQYNRALSIQTQTIGLYHAETAQTLEALAWIAEGTTDNLEEAIVHQKLALNVYRSIFGEEAEDTRAARWKLQYFEDRLAGRRPKSEDRRRLLPALAKFAH